MIRKSPKKYSIVNNYLLKICDRGHHDYYDISLSKFSPEDFYDLQQGKLNFVDLQQSENAQVDRKPKKSDELLKQKYCIMWTI